MLYIEQIRPETTWWLRRDVLYPGMKPAEMAVSEDAEGMHFGAFSEGVLVGVISLFHKQTDFQFRKLAVKTGFQHTGIGTALLETVTRQAISEGGIKLWCNARVSATGFYLKKGFRPTDETFKKNGFDYQIMEKELNLPGSNKSAK